MLVALCAMVPTKPRCVEVGGVESGRLLEPETVLALPPGGFAEREPAPVELAGPVVGVAVTALWRAADSSVVASTPCNDHRPPVKPSASPRATAGSSSGAPPELAMGASGPPAAR